MKLKSCLCMLLLYSGLTHSQKAKNSLLEEIILTDSKFKLKSYQSGRSIIKITQKELENNPSSNLADIINRKSGIEINGTKSNAGQNLGYYVRGGNNRQVLIIIDGIQIMDPQSFSLGYDLRFLSTVNIESVEILKGSSSVLYGSGAASAVINITTKKSGQEKISGRVSTVLGTNQSSDNQKYNPSLSRSQTAINGALDKFTYAIGLGYEYVNGLSAIIDNDNGNNSDVFSKKNILARAGYQSKKFKANLITDYNQFTNEFDESISLKDADYHSDNEQYRIGLTSSYTYLKKGSIYFNVAYDNYKIDSYSSSTYKTKGRTYAFDLFNKCKFTNTFYSVVGLYYQKLNAFSDLKSSSTTGYASQRAPYANLVYVSKFGLNMNAGARLNIHSKYGNNTVYQVNPSYNTKLNDLSSIKFFGMYSTSFIVPTLTQLFGQFGANPDLQPEKNNSIELGSTFYRKNIFKISIAYFIRDENNKVIYDAANKKYINTDKETGAKGLELEVDYTSNRHYDMSFNYTYTNRNNNILVRIPETKINFDFQYEVISKLKTNLRIQYNGSRGDSDFSSFPSKKVSLDSYTLVDLGISYLFFDNRLITKLSLDNIFNQKYQEIYGYTTRGRNLLMSMVYVF